MRNAHLLQFAVSLSILCLGTRSSATILDTLGAFEAKEQGFSGGLKAGFSAQGGNTELLAVSTAAQLQWQNERHRVRAMGGYARQTSDSEEIAEEVMLHLRHNRVLRGPLYSLAFVQIQRSPFQRLRSRTLFGLGGRVDLLQSDRGSASLGAAHMVEIEQLEGQSGRDTAQRLSAFFVLSVRLTATASLRGSIYAQPLWDEFCDLRALGTATLSVTLSKQSALEFGASVQHDSRPPSAVEKTDWTTSTALKIEI
jgi:putative salt-induced outer membrane protein YdiY